MTKHYNIFYPNKRKMYFPNTVGVQGEKISSKVWQTYRLHVIVKRVMILQGYEQVPACIFVYSDDC